MADLASLKAIALRGGLRGSVRISSQSLGTDLGISAQTASRRLIALEDKRLISREMRGEGQYVMITPDGEELLRQEYEDYRRLFEGEESPYRMEGVVITGLGEGRYYMGLSGYRDQFREKFGFEPYPGTLNLRIQPGDQPVRRRLSALDWVKIHGFTAENRTFGEVKALPCRIDKISGAIIVPGRTHYPEDVLEIIAPVNLRQALNLSDGDIVEVEVRP
ncbi:MAG: DUF120 domain-containing protein [Methanoculleaceae archaeon]